MMALQKWVLLPWLALLITACSDGVMLLPERVTTSQTVPNEHEAGHSEWASAETTARLEQYLQELAAAGFNGVVWVDTGGELALAEGYGMADKEAEIANSPSTVFDIGSLTKQFTAAAILKLEMDGRLQVEDALSKYLGEMPVDKEAITLHQLLTHTAGFAEALGDDYTPIGREEFIELAWQSPLVHDPGEDYLYSNVGYSLLAAVIEKVTGQSYEAYLRNALFLPAGMENTGYLLPNWQGDQVAIGYHRGKALGRPNEQPWAEDGPYWHLRGNGGLLSTAEDMYRWHQALLGKTILSNPAKEKYYTPFVAETPDEFSFYGYGWVIVPTPRETLLITHNGGNGIFFADFWRYPTEEIAIFIATNEASIESERLAGTLAQIILDPDFEPVIQHSERKETTTSAEFPGTVAGKTVQHFYDALVNGDDETKETFVAEHFSPSLFAFGTMEQHMEILGGLQSELDSLVLGSISSEENVFALEFFDGQGEFQLRIVVEVAADDPTHLEGISVED